MRDGDLKTAMAELVEQLERDGPKRFGALWSPLLAKYHITRKHLAAEIWAPARIGELLITGMTARERTIKDDHIIAKRDAST